MNRQRLGTIWRKIRWLSILLMLVIGVGVAGCGDRPTFPSFSASRSEARPQPAKIKEVAPPDLIRDLRRDLDGYQPQVQITSPRPDEVLQTQTATVRFAVQDLPLFKDDTFGLGPHLHVFLDDQPYQAVYDSSAPLVLEGLSPGTHTVRAFASRPWHESFKNEGAFAQTTFHVLTKTAEKVPDPHAPLLTYSRPQGSYGAEPIMLDFYLTQVPLHAIAQADDEDEILDWKIRCTINGESFEIDEWRPIYLTGFKPGQNWVQLELLDEMGRAIANVFNDTVRVIDYTPNGQDALSQITRGEVPIVEARRIVIPGYEPPAPEPEVPAVEEEPVETTEDSAGDDEFETVEGLDPGAPTLPAEEENPPVSDEPLPPSLPAVDSSEPDVLNAGEPIEDISPDEMPVEMVAPEANTPPEAALERTLNEPQNSPTQAEPNAAPEAEFRLEDQQTAQAATSSSASGSPSSDLAAQLQAEDKGSDQAPLRDRPTPDATQQSDPTATSPALESGVATAPPREMDSGQAAGDRSTLSPNASESVPSSLSTAKATPSPMLNSYEAKAILEELEDLETKVEDLKGSIVSAAERAPSPDVAPSQIEELRSQLDQLRDKFGDTWQRLSDFMRMKFQS